MKQRITRFACFATLGAMLSACAATTPVAVQPASMSSQSASFAQAAVAQTLRDPYSAQFANLQQFQTSNGDTIVCGQVNARNGFGGYAGYFQFYTRFQGSQLKAIQVDTSQTYMARIGCGNAARGQIGIS